MLNSKQERELCYLVQIDTVEPIEGYDRVEKARIGGWQCIVAKNAFHAGDYGVYFEIDSRVPADNPAFAFAKKYNYKIKTQKMCKTISQGLLMSLNDFVDENGEAQPWVVDIKEKIANNINILASDDRFLTKTLKVVYAVQADNERKNYTPDKYKTMAQRHPKIFRNIIIRHFMQYKFGRKVLFWLFGKKVKPKNTSFPVGVFPGVTKTDQERCENMPWILQDKTPYIVTQKCDGSSGTYILERKKWNRYEFYVCSRNVRMLKPTQECFYEDNYYWEVAIKYDLENKMKDYLQKHPDISFVCWQGEICAPKIQSNPHNLTETHFYAFHFTDSKKGRWDIREAAKIWATYNIEVVPIIDENYIFPDDFEEFKLSADGYYDASVCEGNKKCAREGFVYYKTSDPTFSFKNVSRKYLLKHAE